MFLQSMHYFYAYAFVIISHLISFPILTRILSVSDYGLLYLLIVTIFLVVAFCKSGLQNSFIRFYSEYEDKKEKPEIYYSTFFFTPFPICFIVVLSYFLLVNLIFRNFIDPNTRILLSFISPIILFRAIYILFMSFWRAEQRTKAYNAFLVLSAYLNLLFGISCLFLFRKNISGLLIGYLVSDFILLSTIVYLVLKRHGQNIKFKYFSSDLFKKSLFFGLPLLGMEFTNFMLMSGDRYVIAFLMNTEALGLYSAANNLTSQIAGCLTFPISFAVFPIFMKMWNTEGKAVTQLFLSNALKYSCLIALPLIFGVMAR